MNNHNLRLVSSLDTTTDYVTYPYDERPFFERLFKRPKPDDERVGTTVVAGRTVFEPFVVEGDLKIGQVIEGDIDFGDSIVTRLICVADLGDNKFKCVADMFRDK